MFLMLPLWACVLIIILVVVGIVALIYDAVKSNNFVLVLLFFIFAGCLALTI